MLDYHFDIICVSVLIFKNWNHIETLVRTWKLRKSGPNVLQRDSLFQYAILSGRLEVCSRYSWPTPLRYDHCESDCQSLTWPHPWASTRWSIFLILIRLFQNSGLCWAALQDWSTGRLPTLTQSSNPLDAIRLSPMGWDFYEQKFFAVRSLFCCAVDHYVQLDIRQSVETFRETCCSEW